MEELSAAALEIFGYEPRPWQLKAALKLLEGHDCMVVAGTGSGKSLVFALVAIAIELTHSTGLIIVICPLKALQQDQVSMSYVVRMCSTVFTGLVGPPSECCGGIDLSAEERQQSGSIRAGHSREVGLSDLKTGPWK